MAFKKEISKFLKEIQENIIKQLKKMKKIVQDVEMEIEAIKKTWTKAVLEMAHLEKRIGTMHRRITNRIQEMEKRIWGLEDKIEEIDISIGKG